jgi:transposase
MWTAQDKHRIVEEAMRPGASVADIARRHDVNANLVFNWRRTARSGDLAPSFIPIGVFGRAENDGPALLARPSPAAQPQASLGPLTRSRPALDERPGVIEIDLPSGTRIRLDAFVNERALRRVLSVLKAMP